MQNRFTRSNLELRRPKNGLKIGTRSSRGVRSAQLLVEIPNLPTNMGLEGVRRRELAKSRPPIRNPSSIRNPRNPSLLECEKP
eukprot:13161512-Alexandrium_andersonii.AAC.1